MTRHTTPVVVCIDVEPDDRKLGSDAPEWRGVERTLEMIDRWRAPPDRGHGV